MNNIMVKNERRTIKMQMKEFQKRSRALDSAEKKMKKISYYLDQHLMSLRGTKKLGDLLAKADKIDGDLVSNDVIIMDAYDALSPNAGNTCDVEVEYGQDLADNELSKDTNVNNAHTKSENKRIARLRHIVLTNPNALFTYINIWKQGKNGPIDDRFYVQYASPITIAREISKMVLSYNNEQYKITNKLERLHSILV